MPFNVGPMELIIVLALALIVLGPKRLPEAGKAIGKGMREFKDSLAGDSKDEDDDATPAIPAGSATTAPTTPTATPAAEAQPAESPFAQR
jgi:sec-independent protein translocase protein TatA